MTHFNEETLSERDNSEYNDGPRLHTSKYETKVPSLHKIHIILLSLAVALLSVANPLLTDAANSLQSQNLYVGMMLTKGQIPYSDVFSTGGMMYFVLIALSYKLGTSLFLVVVQAFCFYMTGIYFYKLINYFTASQKVSSAFYLLYYLFSFALGFGGLYSIQFALPFVMMSLWFLTKYFVNLVKDEAFILFGFSGAMAMLIEPQAMLFWLLAAVTIIIYNIKEKHIARGFYQLLAAILGMLFVFYTAGYFILNLQILGPYFAQAVKYQFTYFASGNLSLAYSVLYYLVLALGLGLLTGPIYVIGHLKNAEDRMVKALLVLLVVFYLLLALLSQDMQSYHLLPVLPFALILTALPIAEKFLGQFDRLTHRRSKVKKGTSRVISLFLSRHLFLPIVLLLLSLFLPVKNYLTQFQLNHTRQEVATYIAKETKESDRIFVWDDNARIYLSSQRKVASQFPSADVNLKKESHQKILEDELLQKSAAYIVINKNKKMPDKVTKIIEKNYKIDKTSNLSPFLILKVN
ncbi:DUF2079 domain-containing protein [Streptococcus iniae]|uniref:DUF2079 domain-containing protein n=1 Tax=Streptococcus iniae TaxID=1346 RepID=UPI0008D96C95|nr:DUF2079 domain-containing protein [Streptococcus iniae]OHX28168.1 DUF2079 domain-containing protein [Streptococcus iniae]RLV26903.1 DUF2079 domain-containing protein [Streptococcus iniae]